MSDSDIPNFTVDQYGREIHDWMVHQGFYETSDAAAFSLRQLMLIVSETAEAAEAIRDNDYEQEAEEVADILIRTLDYAAWRGFMMEVEVPAKMAKNRKRARLHGRQM